MPNTAYSASQKKKRISDIATIIISTFLVLSGDQVSKTLVSLNMRVGQSIPIIKGILHITFVRNTGAAFGLFRNSTGFFAIISITAVLVILSILARSLREGKFSANFLFNFGLTLIMAGAFGNLIDRLKFGYVIDFIDVRIWPVFNIADSSITIGTFLLLLTFTKKPS